MTVQQQLHSLLIELEQHLIAEKLHSHTIPSADALASTQPFCIDTLEIEQWIQFVMLPKFQQLIEQQQTLPKIKKTQGIANIAEFVFAQRGIAANTQQTLSTIKKIDQLLEE